MIMDSTHHMERSLKVETLETFSRLPKVVRTAFAAGEAFGHLRAQVEEDDHDEDEKK